MTKILMLESGVVRMARSYPRPRATWEVGAWQPGALPVGQEEIHW